MIIEVEKQLDQTIHINRAVNVGGELSPREGVMYSSPVTVDLVLSFRKETVIAQGTYNGSLLACCDRSLKRFPVPVSGSIDIIYRKDDRDIQESDVSLSEDDLNVSFHQGVLDISQVINESVALSLPMKLLSPDMEEAFTISFGEDSEEEVDDRFVILQELKDRMKKRSES